MQETNETHELRRVCQHVFLPPQLPQTADEHSDVHLMRVAVKGLIVLNDLLPSVAAVKAAIVALKHLQAINDLPSGAVNESALLQSLRDFENGQTIPIHVPTQNAAIMVSRKKNFVIFEEFELSPQNEAVMTSIGRLIRTFPGLAIAVDVNKAELADFAPMVANMVATLSQQLVPGMQPQSRKAGTDNDECRDTTDPAAVSELFFGFLKGFGEPVTVSAISKNTRDDVIWKDTKAPWRRSPVWLLIRVVLQLTIERWPDGSRLLYKETMAFLLSQVLEASLPHEFASDMYYVMSAKIARRMCKLQEESRLSGHALHRVLTTSVDHVLQRTSCILSLRWKKIQSHNESRLDLGILTHLDFDADTHVILPTLDTYLKQVQSRQDCTKSLHFSPTSSLIKNMPDDLFQLPGSTRVESTYMTANLQQFEQWTERHLDSWVAPQKDAGTCKRLYETMVQYHGLAVRHYAGNPEGMSVMILTLFALWIACDKAALSINTLLAEYSADVQPEILENLLLPSFRQMERLRLVESYLKRRTLEPQLKSSDMLFEMMDPESFASRYFRGSRSHQELLAGIQNDALQARLIKQAEFSKTRSDYQRLDTLYNDSSCEYVTVVLDDWTDPPETAQQHSKGCAKCSYQRQRDALVISVHEWPLPQDELEAEAVVFELDVPSWLAYWRDARCYLLQDVLKGECDAVDVSRSYRLSTNDPHLSRQYFRGPASHRIDLVSSCKPFAVSHYSAKNMHPGLRESDVCVANGLRYQYYDSASDRYPSNLRFRDTIVRSCTYMLSRTQLQDFIFRPSASPDGPPPNAAIASQDSCPADMTLEEYKELCSVPLGRHIQWENMALQLAMPSVDFKKGDTMLVFLQCAYQAGPRNGTTLREAHQLFQHDSTLDLLLSHLEAGMNRVEQNWESATALSLFVAMLTRIFSLNGRRHDECFRLLAFARDIGFKWMEVLRDRAYAAADDQSRTVFVSKAIEVALICALTFDVDECHLDALFTSPVNVSSLVQCSIVVQQGEHVKAHSERNFRLLYLRYQRLLHRSYSRLGDNHVGLDDAIKNSWSAYVPGSAGWRRVSDAADHWFTTDTAAGRRMHYDILSGELLVDGIPLDQPPKHYQNHLLYQRLFGRSVIEVMPASSAGFQFSTKRRFEGCEVQLGMHYDYENKEDTLTVQTTNGHESFETVPSYLLAEAYPAHFVQEYVHWYNHKSREIDFRPLQCPWKSCHMTGYVLRKLENGNGWHLSKLDEVVVGLRAITAQAIAKVFQPLAAPARIHCVFNTTISMLSVEIPKLRLKFVLSPGCSTLHSKEFRGTMVDRNQSLGTLIGLVNMLLLTNDAGERTLLIPESGVSYGRHSGHIIVEIDQDATSKVHALRVDNQLHRLVDSGDMQCKLYLSYLHALTAFCLPDPLTCKTGTEQAMSILASSAVRSFDQLSQPNIDILAKIARLSPCRRYYPVHKKSMQIVDWDGRLDPMAQHAGLASRVEDLFQQAHRASLFLPRSELHFPRPPQDDVQLQRRDLIRTSSFRVSGFGAEDHRSDHDSEYSPRDRNTTTERAAHAAVLSNLVYRPGTNKHWDTPTAEQLWEKMCPLSTIHQALQTEDVCLRYNSSSVSDGVQYVLTNFPALHQKMANLQHSKKNSFATMAWLSGLAFSADGGIGGIAQMFALLYKSTRLADITPPTAACFLVKEGKDCSAAVLKRIVEQHQYRLVRCPEYQLERGRQERHKAYEKRRQRAWRAANQSSVTRFVDELASQWPCEYPYAPTTGNASTYVNINGAMADVRAKFRTWHDNLLFYRYLEAIVAEMCRLDRAAVRIPQLAIPGSQRPPSLPGYVSDALLFQLPPPQSPDGGCRSQISVECESVSQCFERPRLQHMIDALEASVSPSKYERQYLDDLKLSLAALRVTDHRLIPHLDVTHEDMLRDLCYRKDLVATMYEALAKSVSGTQSAFTVRQWPRISPTWFLQQLSYTRRDALSDGWRKAIVDYGIALTGLQRAERLVKLASTSGQDELVNEAQNIGHTNWSPYEYPDSLLIEVENGIMIRPVQEEISKQMCAPNRPHNTVMQLNMGEGKSSVIAPVAGTRLADGVRLSCIIVAKAQSKQMMNMLIAKLGGLVDRRIYHLPFSRSLKVDVATAETVESMLQECVHNRGILLVQPEHLLSLKLMALECYITGREDVGNSLMRALDYLHHYARDLVDESDENFSVRFELIYTMGLQSSVDLSPDRWLLTQHVLGLVQKLAPIVVRQHPGAFEIHPSFSGGFSRIRILHTEVGGLLVDCIAAYICNNGLGGLQVSRQSETVRHAVFVYITKFELDDVEVRAVEDGSFWSESTKASLLLLRGFLACGILMFALSHKRWRVNYGLTSRIPSTKLAVPYRAKDCPSPRSEFSHPDVVIVLTSLCHYYQGLDNEDLFITLAHLVDSDQADIEYQAWVRDAVNLPVALRQLQGVNLEDQAQCISELFPALRYGKSIVDYFLAHIVFPKEMKEFPQKLSASGWDIGKRKKQITTGFSGTNDSRTLLPLDIKHLDLVEQKHTNALVLDFLLQNGNSVQPMTPAEQSVTDAAFLLGAVTKLNPPVQVILDVGAQILELNNLEVARAWLELSDTSKEAVIFVNEDDELCVLDRQERVDRLQTSPFATRPDTCLVFLDESHTRGIDLKLPVHYRAAVTLGAGLSKDRLVQACMRMRKLGKGQTVVFCIPPEIQIKIKVTRSAKSDPCSDITVADVLCWSISETHAEMRRNMPLWLAQGQRFHRQQKLWEQAIHNGTTILNRGCAEAFLEQEALPVERRYSPRLAQGAAIYFPDADDVASKLMSDRCHKFDRLEFRSSTLQEEQERELSPEVEQERQVQKALPATPATHCLHQDVARFALSDDFKHSSTAYIPAFQSLTLLTCASGCELSQLIGEGKLLVSTDYTTTVIPGGTASNLDGFQRPVCWLLTQCAPGGSSIDRIMIISPFEANLLRPLMATSPNTLHLYKPRTNFGFATLDDLCFHAVSAGAAPSVVPRLLAAQLNLFAGQLYFSSYGDYLETCRFLGLLTQHLSQDMEDAGWRIDAEGFILRDLQGRIGGESGVTKSPMKFLKVFTSKVRRNGDGIKGTHIGSLLEGRLFQVTEWSSESASSTQ